VDKQTKSNENEGGGRKGVASPAMLPSLPAIWMVPLGDIWSLMLDRSNNSSDKKLPFLLRLSFTVPIRRFRLIADPPFLAYYLQKGRIVN